MNNADKEMKEKQSQVLRIIIVVFVIILVASTALVIGTTYSRSYVAKVGNEKVTVPEYKLFLKQAKNNILSIVAGADPETFWDTDINGKKAIDIAREKAIESVKEFKIEIIKARQTNISLAKEDNDNINNYINQIIAGNNNDRSVANAYSLAVNGVSLDEFKQIYTNYVLTEKFLRNEMDNIIVSDEDAQKIFDDDPRSCDLLTVRHILISTIDSETQAPLSDEKKKEAGNKAQELLERVKSGEDMAALAKEFSQDPAVKDNSGEYTFDRFDSYTEKFEDWAIKANEGDIGIVETPFGYHIMKLEKRVTATFDGVKQKIVNEKKASVLAQKLVDWKSDPAYAVTINDKVYNSIE